MYKNLKKYYNNIENKTYFLQVNKISHYKKFYEKYIVVHLDEKYRDIFDINTNFEKSLRTFQKKINKKIILTSFKNNYEFYQNLNFVKINYANLNDNIISTSKILIIEDSPLDYLQDLIQNSYINISCHAGYFVHTSLALDKKTIDIINKDDEIWYNNWININDNYKRVYKSNINEKNNIEKILNQIENEIKKN